MTLQHPNLKSYYHRRRQFNRQGSEIKHTILNTIVKRGPVSITQICYLMQTSHRQAKKFIRELISDGLIESISLIQNHGRIQKPKEVKHLATIHQNVVMVFKLTSLGRKYIVKSNRLEAMIHWGG